MALRTTRSVVIMTLSRSAYDEIAAELRAAGYEHAFLREGNEIVLDMDGIAIAARTRAITASDGEPRTDLEPDTTAASASGALDGGGPA